MHTVSLLRLLLAESYGVYVRRVSLVSPQGCIRSLRVLQVQSIRTPRHEKYRRSPSASNPYPPREHVSILAVAFCGTVRVSSALTAQYTDHIASLMEALCISSCMVHAPRWCMTSYFCCMAAFVSRRMATRFVSLRFAISRSKNNWLKRITTT